MKLIVKNNERFVRDADNLAILNTDRDAIKRHENKMEQMKKMKVREEEFAQIKKDISELKDLLRELINGKHQ